MIRLPEGTVVTVEGKFYDTAGSLADPSLVYLTVTNPSLIETTYTYLVGAQVSRFSQGIYRSDLDSTGKRGLWIFTWWSTGTYQADSGEQEFYIE